MGNSQSPKSVKGNLSEISHSSPPDSKMPCQCQGIGTRRNLINGNLLNSTQHSLKSFLWKWFSVTCVYHRIKQSLGRRSVKLVFQTYAHGAQGSIGMTTLKFLRRWLHSAMVAVGLLTQGPRVWFQTFAISTIALKIVISNKSLSSTVFLMKMISSQCRLTL